MGTHRHILKTLRSIALEHAGSAHPDLASMARELGRVVHQDASSMATRLASLRRRQRGFEQILLSRRNKPPLSLWIVAWPANHVSPLREHGVWGLEMALVGALEVQSCQRDAASNELTVLDRQWLGPGDGAWFDGEVHQLRRCRNLSRYETALSLHVYGDDMADYATPGRSGPAAAQLKVAPRHITASRLHG
ncbi:cysteine dioxygenase [Rhodanobacter sp. FDAARGOS 1247]|uniref:cysteine dioxygenase n=1 Tax=Rhodanobacter sp. FDAARGOS 1247 TaxID=2778082 RepID=UPI00194F4F54|nr:cysteine dioxygenase [Rhodanobacter sp. FDAARGOS 1247]QRP63456.1 cysteine dioxygenase [Rhodanobacter sp. FDAARGOS 1247]